MDFKPGGYPELRRQPGEHPELWRARLDAMPATDGDRGWLFAHTDALRDAQRQIAENEQAKRDAEAALDAGYRILVKAWEDADDRNKERFREALNSGLIK